MKRVICSGLFILILVSLSSCSDNMWNKNSYPIETKQDNHAIEDYLSFQSKYEDLYKLSNCQNIYEEILRHHKEETRTSSTLAPTHYAIKIYPKTFSEQLSYENDSTLTFSYLPFGFNSPTSEEIIDEPIVNDSISVKCCVIEEDQFYQESHNITPLYVIWPVGKTIPSDVEYELIFEIFDPYSSDLPDSIISEMMASLLSDNSRVFPDIPGAYVTLRAYDNLLEQYVPLKHITVKANFGSIIKTYTTDNNGVAYIPSKYGNFASCSYLLCQDQFSVRDSVTSAIVERSLGFISIGDMINFTDTYHTFNRPETFYDVIYQAADYYFQENTYCSSEISQMNPIPIYGEPSHTPYEGRYSLSLNNIYISDKHQNERQMVIGTTLHELGHYFQDSNRTGVSISTLPLIFLESFACCNGYYLGELYYISKGYVKPYSWYDVVGQSQQYWFASSGWPYSPLFIDLIDSYNQHNHLSLYPDDIIEGVSFNTILQMAMDADDLMDIRSILISDICPPYSITQIDSQLSVYISLF